MCGRLTYLNEADVYEPNYEAFWGDHYPELATIKMKYDPDRLLDCWQCIGWDSESSRCSEDQSASMTWLIIQSWYQSLYVRLSASNPSYQPQAVCQIKTSPQTFPIAILLPLTTIFTEDWDSMLLVLYKTLYFPGYTGSLWCTIALFSKTGIAYL
ncbi:hypothetical protein B0H10DRAFT_1948381 [Mycena sp. CBHHK59/15]|nr:hypothetical protein B0H10DRAFT_1948381 [Mycena sp. CBHHK59/15]